MQMSHETVSESQLDKKKLAISGTIRFVSLKCKKIKKFSKLIDFCVLKGLFS